MLRPVITKSAVVCVAIAAAPWLSGGQMPLGRLVSGFALLLGLLLVWRQPEGPVLKRGPLLGAFVLLIGLAGLSLQWSANKYSSALWITEWVMAGLAFKLAISISASEVGRKWLLRAYLVSAGLFAAVGVVMYLTSQYGRLTGTFYWANPAAAYLIPAIIIAIDGIRRTEGRLRYGWSAAAAGLSAAFLLTDSRAATAVLALIAVLYLALAKLSKRFWIHFLFSAVSAWVLSYGIVQLSSLTVTHSNKVAPGSRLNEAIKGESSSGSDRLYYLGSAWDMFAAHPLGVGAGAYGDVHPQYQRRVVSASANAHNVYAQTLAELGIMGVLLLGTVVVILFIGILRGLFVRPEMLPAALGIFGLLLHFGLDIDASYPALLMLVGILAGLIYSQSSIKWVKQPIWAPLVAALVLVPTVSLYLSDTWAVRAQAAQEDADYALAAEDYSRADHQLVFNPDNISAEGINLYALSAGGGQDAKADLTLALERARRAEQLDPHDGQHYQLEGRVLMQMGDVAGAQKAFTRALELDSFNHPDYALDLALVQDRLGRPQAALSTVQIMLDQYPAKVVANRAADETLKFQLAKLKAVEKQLKGEAATAAR